ncbi:MAG: class I SAM-dependent methyltransferase [Pseudomonadota bacterium]
MDPAVYQRMAEHEEQHWWFRGRRAVLKALLDRLDLPPEAKVLEAGCGSGGNLPLLATYGELDAFEYDRGARQAASARRIASVVPGALPDNLPSGGPYDLIALLDVLEHLEDDVASIKALARRLTRTGSILITVPAGPWLWSQHDDTHHHFRRYTQTGLNEVITAAGLEVQQIGKMNSLLFPLAVAQRLWLRFAKSGRDADELPPPWLNKTLEATFKGERHLVGRVPMPFGLSLWAIAGRAAPQRLDVRA